MSLVTEEERAQLLNNGAAAANGERRDALPVVRLFTPDFRAVWLLTELDPTNPDIAFGLCDLGLGTPELGSVSLSEIASVRGKFGLPVERDLHFNADRSLSRYADDARKAGIIIA